MGDLYEYHDKRKVHWMESCIAVVWARPIGLRIGDDIKGFQTWDGRHGGARHLGNDGRAIEPVFIIKICILRTHISVRLGRSRSSPKVSEALAHSKLTARKSVRSPANGALSESRRIERNISYLPVDETAMDTRELEGQCFGDSITFSPISCTIQ